MRRETEYIYDSMRRRLNILESMIDAMKWLTKIEEENSQLKASLGDHDLTRIQLIESEREREDLRLLADSLGARLDVWRTATLEMADIIFALEKKGVKLTKVQQRKLTNVVSRSLKERKPR